MTEKIVFEVGNPTSKIRRKKLNGNALFLDTLYVSNSTKKSLRRKQKVEKGKLTQPGMFTLRVSPYGGTRCRLFREDLYYDLVGME